MRGGSLRGGSARGAVDSRLGVFPVEPADGELVVRPLITSRLLSDPRVGGAICAFPSVLTSTGRSFLFTSRANRSRFRIVPRGTPKPAEPGSIFTRCTGPVTGLLVRPRPTITVVRVRTGGCGMTVLTGGFTTRGTGYQLFQYPGCQTHP